MVGNLKYKRRDPNGKRRGVGWYWHRGRGKYSKYTGVVDAKRRGRSGRLTKDKTTGKTYKGKRLTRVEILSAHKGDYKPKRTFRTTKRNYKGHYIRKGRKGKY